MSEISIDNLVIGIRQDGKVVMSSVNSFTLAIDPEVALWLARELTVHAMRQKIVEEKKDRKDE